MEKQPLRRRITPAVPYIMNVENADGTTFELSFRLSYDLNSLTLVEEVTGLSMFTDLGALLSKPKAGTVSVLLWAAVQENHAEYGGLEGLQAIRNLLTMGEAKNALAKCSEAFVAQLPRDQAAKLKAAAEGKATAPLAQAPLAE